MKNSIDQCILSISQISSLSLNDEKFLKSALFKNQIPYARSFLYVLRASSDQNGNLGYKYVDQNLIAIIGYRHNTIYILPIIDQTQGVMLGKLCKTLIRATGCRVLLKKFSSQVFPNIALQPSSNTNLSDSQKEDDAYPEKISNLNHLFMPSTNSVNPNAKRFIRKIKRFEKTNIEFSILDDITQIPLKNLEQFFMKNPKMYASYYPMIIYLIKSREDNRYKTSIFLYKNKIHGIYVSEVFSDTDAGLYCALTSRAYQGSTEWMDWYFFRKMRMLGIQTLYLGGAESKGVEYYIKKLLPVNPPINVETIEYLPSLAKQETSTF